MARLFAMAFCTQNPQIVWSVISLDSVDVVAVQEFLGLLTLAAIDPTLLTRIVLLFLCYLANPVPVAWIITRRRRYICVLR